MTVQMTVRIPDDLAAFVDDRVEQGTQSSRAQVIAAALRREKKRMMLADERVRVQASLAADGNREPWEPGADPEAARDYNAGLQASRARALADLD